MTEHELQTKVRNAFRARFQEEPAMIVRAPGRVNIIGEHTDYNDGFVLPVAVDQAAWLAVSPSGDDLSRIRAVDMGNDDQAFTMQAVPVSNGGWADYPKGVVWAMLDEGMAPVGIHGVLTSDVPVGAGMSSSAAIEVAFAYAWALLSDIEIKLSDLALLCQKAENQYVGVNCGIMDQMISACGKADNAMMLDTRTLERAYFSVPQGVAIVVANSMVRRSLTGSEYNVRRAQCEQAVSVLQTHYPEVKALRDVTPDLLSRHQSEFSDVVYRRARHVVTENARVLQVSRDLYEGRMAHVGELLLEGHRSLRDDYEVSIPELDTLVEAAAEVDGCYGARLTGAGFGGCIIALAEEAAVPDVEAHLTEVYQAQHDREPAVYVSRADNGVSRMA